MEQQITEALEVVINELGDSILLFTEVEILKQLLHKIQNGEVVIK